MRTAVDTNVLLDILTNSPFAPAAREALLASGAEGSLCIGEIVYAELATAFEGEAEGLHHFLQDLSVRLVLTPQEGWLKAGALWRSYRRRGGSRKRILPDFMVAAHAITTADRLLTRDDGFYKKWLQELDVLEPDVV